MTDQQIKDYTRQLDLLSSKPPLSLRILFWVFVGCACSLMIASTLWLVWKILDHMLAP